jgi:hypothetical protein
MSKTKIDCDELEALARKAETGEQWAEVCRLEAIALSLRSPQATSACLKLSDFL